MDTTTDPQPAPDAPPGDGPRATRDEVRDLGRLRRTTGQDRKIAGVVGGLARHLDVDPLMLRVAMVVLVFFGGAGLIVYAAVWLLVPEDGAPRPPFGFDDRSRSIALVIAGGLAALALLGDTLGAVGFPWPLVLIATLALIVFAFLDRDSRRRPGGSWVPPRPPSEPAAATTFTAESPTVPAASAYVARDYASGWIPPTPPDAPTTATWRARPPHPRKRGPKLFWFTVALSALAVGTLGIADLAGAGVADAAYPALVLTICGAVLVLGAFYGRAGGVILLGLLAGLGTLGALVDEHWSEPTVRTPATAAAVQEKYELGAGELVLDLTDLEDLEALDGRTIEVHMGLGSVEVIVPDGMDVSAQAEVGLGDVTLFDQRQDGGGIKITGSHDGGSSAPDIDIEIHIGLGEVDVHTESTEGAF